MQTLSIITPVTRPENLRAIAESIKEANENANGFFDIIWYVIFDTEEYGHVQLPHDVGVFIFARPCFSGFEKLTNPNGTPARGNKINSFGGKQRNYALDLIESGFVYFLDDDNIMKDSFLVDLKDTIEFCENKKAFIFDLVNPDGSVILTAHYDNIKIDSIDTAQFVLAREIIGNVKWGNEYNSDGKFIFEVYAVCPEAFQIAVGEAYYNYLRQNGN